MGRGFRRFFEEIPKKIAQFSQISLYFFENFSYHEVAIRMEGSGSRLRMRLRKRRKGPSAGFDQWEESSRRIMADKRMTQSQFVKKIAAACGVSNKVAKAFVDVYAATAVEQTKKTGVFVLPGLGRLVRVERKARMGRNPATGEPIKIPAKKVVKFRVAKAVKDAIVPPKKK
jgi:DNA-binding protein HU-beta